MLSKTTWAQRWCLRGLSAASNGGLVGAQQELISCAPTESINSEHQTEKRTVCHLYKAKRPSALDLLLYTFHIFPELNSRGWFFAFSNAAGRST